MAKDDSKGEGRKTTAKRLIKYVGDSDNRVLEAGEDWSGRLSDGLPSELRWSWENNHLVDVGDLDDEAVELLLEDPDFKDVTGMKSIPVAAVVKRRRASQVTKGALTPSGVGGDAPGPIGGQTTPGATTAGSASI